MAENFSILVSRVLVKSLRFFTFAFEDVVEQHIPINFQKKCAANQKL
jgi:hypothetical protein